MSLLLRLAAIVLLLATPALAHAKRTLALVIGINNYQFVPTLDGARGDAEDLTAALRKGGAARIVTLVDRQATKQNIGDAWRSLLAEAESGDVLFLSYAGHGAQAPQRKTIDEADKLDEFLVLPGFNPKNVRDTWQETIFDNELNLWFAEAGRKGVRVVFVSDSCHAGGMDRAVKGRMRYVELGRDRVIGELFAMMLKSDDKPADEGQRLDNLTLLAATPEALPVPEIVINGQPRGALSWTVARAIEGMADRDGDGAITRLEMEDYVFATVRMRSESLQNPVFSPVSARSPDEVMIHVTAPANSSEPTETSQTETANTETGQNETGQTQAGHAGTAQLAQESGGHSAGQAMPMARELGFDPVLQLDVTGADIMPPSTVKGKFAFEWDAAKGIFKTPNGDVAAENISAYTVNDVVSKFILIDFLKALATSNPGRIDIRPAKSLYLAGERLKIEALRGRYRNMVVFNLANTGEVQFIDMVVNGEPAKKTPLQEMQVVEPFGSDHLVTLSSNEPLEAIGQAIERGVAPDELLKILSARIDGRDVAVAVLPIYTRGR